MIYSISAAFLHQGTKDDWLSWPLSLWYSGCLVGRKRSRWVNYFNVNIIYSFKACSQRSSLTILDYYLLKIDYSI